MGKAKTRGVDTTPAYKAGVHAAIKGLGDKPKYDMNMWDLALWQLGYKSVKGGSDGGTDNN